MDSESDSEYRTTEIDQEAAYERAYDAHTRKLLEARAPAVGAKRRLPAASNPRVVLTRLSPATLGRALGTEIVPEPVPVPRRQEEEMQVEAPSTSTQAAIAPQPAVRRHLPADDSKRMLEERLERLEEELATCKQENAALRRELQLMAFGTRTLTQLASEGPPLTPCSGNQATGGKKGPSKSRLRRAQRQRAARRLLGNQPPGEMRQSKQPRPVQSSRQSGVQSRLQQWSNGAHDVEHGAWREVRGRKNRQQQPQPRNHGRRRPDAVLVMPAPGVKYVDVYRPVRTDEGIRELQPLLTNSRRTPAGYLRMELNPKADSTEICRRVQGVLGERGTVKVLKEMAEVVIKNIDPLTEEQQIREAIKASLGTEHELQSFRMWERADATQRARIRLPREEAEKLDGRRLLIGYSSCHFQMAPRVEMARKRCFRCLERGHLASVCTGEDRTGMCIRCGEDGHKAATCEKAIHCSLCGGSHRIAAHNCKASAARR